MCLCIWTTFLSSHHLSRYTYSMSAEFCSVCLRTACLPRRRSACFMPSLSRFSVRWFRRKGLAWTLTRFVLSLIGPFQILESLFRGFWGLPIYYRRFIRNFSQVAAPLTFLTSSKTRFTWSEAAQGAFDRLKGLFTSAPILITPDPEKQFIVEVDASDVGVGAILSQRSSLDDKIHPCAFYSHRLSPAERNYDVGNRELWRSVWR